MSIKFDDTDNDESDFLEFIDEPNEANGIAVYFYDNGDGTHVIEAYSWGSRGYYDITIPDDQFFNQWLNIYFMFTIVGGMVNVDFSVDGFGSGSFTMDLFTYQLTTLNIGSIYASNNTHRSIRDVNLIANTSSLETDFNFPADSFDSLVGSASIVGSELRIDDDTGTDSYAIKTVDPAYDFNCCFCDISPMDSITTATLEMTATATDGCPGGCMNVVLDINKTWTRISSGTPGENEFVIFCKSGPDINRVDFRAGFRATDGTLVTDEQGFRLAAFTADFITCFNDSTPGPDDFIEGGVGVGNLRQTGSGIDWPGTLNYRGPYDYMTTYYLGDVISSPYIGGNYGMATMTSTGQLPYDTTYFVPLVTTQAYCNQIGMIPYIATAVFDCPGGCEDTWYAGLPADNNIDLDMVAGVHTWSQSPVFPGGTRLWAVTWTLTLA
jgi:hypothetical protein